MPILIYQDYIHNNGALHRNLCAHFGADAVRFCDAADILDGMLTGDIKLFVMPGGADLYYAEKLNGAGNKAIRKYVEEGGVYLGICAGAYYGCAALQWAAGTDQHIGGPRELAFFPGTAVGPILDLIEEGDITKSWRAAPEITWDDDKAALETHVFYEAGPVFVPSGDHDDYKVLARYSTLPGKPIAIVECSVGTGKAILCGPHPDSTASDLERRLYRHRDPSYEWNESVAHALRPHETQGRQLWSMLLERCAA
jgi:glutamine amidotransferase-like uncharacterized protein